jgi:hypothetical protein
MRIRSIRLATLGVLLSGLLATAARGADEARLDDINLTNTIAGGKMTDGALKNKVVLVEFWGIN